MPLPPLRAINYEIQTINSDIKMDITKISEVELVYKTKVKPAERPRVINSRQSFEIFKSIFEQNGKIEHKELMYVLLLNRGSKVLGVTLISEGGVSGTVCDPKLIFQAAIKSNASAIILCHNHPSGETNPSHADIELTKTIKEGGKILEIKLLDHIIITPDNTYTSLADEGHI